MGKLCKLAGGQEEVGIGSAKGCQSSASLLTILRQACFHLSWTYCRTFAHSDRKQTNRKIEDLLSKVWREVDQRFKAMCKAGQKSKTLDKLISR